MPANETVGMKSRSVYDLSGGMVTNYNFSRVQANQLKRLLNSDLSNDGSAVTRYGRSKANTRATAYTVSHLLSLGNTSGADTILMGLTSSSAGAGFLVDTGGNYIKSGLSDEPLDSAIMNEYGFFVNGTDDPFISDGTVGNTYQMGIEQVTSVQYAAMAVANVGGGALSTAGSHRVKFRYRSTVTGARSNPYTSSQTITIGAGDQYQFTPGLASISSDAQVDQIDYFAQEAGVAADAPYYYLGSSSNAVAAYTFDVSDDELIVLETLDIDDNVAPSELRDIENFKGRMVAVSGDYTIRYSKKRVDQNGVVNLPTSWPATNEMNVGWGDGDPLVKVMRFGDSLFAFKRRSIWLLIGDFDSDSFEFKQLKTNFTNVGLLNNRCVVQAGDSVYFISDDLKMQRFSSTDFSTTELRLEDPPPSDRVANLFTDMASLYRDFVNMVNFTFAQYTQIWISFTDGATGTVAGDNYSTFVFDYTSGGGVGAWHIHTGHEVASAVLARDSNLNYNIYTGDYQGYLWKHDDSFGDGAAYNFTGNMPDVNHVYDDAGGFTADMDGCLVRCISNTNGYVINEVRRMTYSSATTASVSPAWSGTGVGTYTVGGIDFQVVSRDDWLDDSTPIDYDKQGWYLDIDVTSEGSVSGSTPAINQLKVELYKNRTSQFVGYTKEFDFTGAAWGSGIWGSSLWPEGTVGGIQVGLNIFFQQMSHKISSNIAGQRLRVNGWTYHFQNLGKVRAK